MEELTKQEAIKLHRKMWKIISEMSDEDMGGSVNKDIKIPTLKKMGIEPGNIDNLCFCCEYDNTQQKDCSTCPIKWKNGRCYLLNSEYMDFYLALKDRNFSKSKKNGKDNFRITGEIKYGN